MKPRPKKKLKTKATAAKRRPVKVRAHQSAARRPAVKHDIKRLARRWFEELWGKRNADALEELMDPAAIGDTEGGTVSGQDDFRRKLHAPLVGAFPDLQLSVDGVVAEGNDAVVRWTIEATHTGDHLGIPASHRRVRIGGMTWLSYRNGKVVAGWDRWNAAGLMACLKDGAPSATVYTLPSSAPP